MNVFIVIGWVRGEPENLAVFSDPEKAHEYGRLWQERLGCLKYRVGHEVQIHRVDQIPGGSDPDYEPTVHTQEEK